MSTDEKMRDRALFYIDRRIATLDAAHPTINPTALAVAGVSYAERRRLYAKFAEQQEKNQHELEAWQWLRRWVLYGG